MCGACGETIGRLVCCAKRGSAGYRRLPAVALVVGRGNSGKLVKKPKHFFATG